MSQRRVLCFLRRKSLSKRVSEGREACFFIAEKQFDKFKKHAMIPINNYKIMEI
jgi:hypothetical protein